MKKIILFAGILISGSIITAQNCTSNLPSGTIMVKKADGSHSNLGDVLWVCDGVTMDVSGDDNTIYAEENTVITLSGDGNTLHIKKGTATVTGDMNEISYYGASVTITDNGTNTVTGSSCDTLFFNYEKAPDPPVGCDAKFVGIKTVTNFSNSNISIFPNPVNNVLFVHVDGKMTISSYSLYSITGQMELTGQVSGELKSIDLSEVKSGLYFIQFQTSEGIKSQRLTIE